MSTHRNPTFLKIGGSLITDKRVARSLRRDVLDAVSRAVARAIASRPFPLLIGHGGGSFGHFPARDFAVVQGLSHGAGWEGFHRTRQAMVELNGEVVSALQLAGLEAVPVQPSSTCVAEDGRLVSFDPAPLSALLAHGAHPVIFGDAVVDRVRGFTIVSTEALFLHLAPRLEPRALVILSDVPGVLPPGGGTPLPEFDASALATLAAGENGAADVTGGIASKARFLLDIAAAVPAADVRLLSGLDPDAVERALLGEYEGGTRFSGLQR